MHSRLRWLIGLLAVIAGGGFAYWTWQAASLQRLARQTESAVQDADYRLAFDLANDLLRRQPGSAVGLRAAGKASWMLHRFKRGLEYYEQLIEQGAELTADDHFVVGQLSLQMLDPVAAERHYRQALALDSKHGEARNNLIYLLAIQCRTNEANEQRRLALRHQQYEDSDLLYLTRPVDILKTNDRLAFLERNPHNPHLLLSNARFAMLAHAPDEARKWVELALAADPQLVEAHADRGLLLLEGKPTDADFARWSRQLPPGAESHPDVWIVRGDWARARDDIRGAARCYGEALARDPNFGAAAHRLSQVMAALGNDAAVKQLSLRVERLDALARAADDVYNQPQSSTRWQQGAQLLESLGRDEEAAAWYRNAALRDPQNQLALQKSRELAARTPRELAHDAPPDWIQQLGFAQYPLPQFAGVAVAAAPSAGQLAPRGALRFVDVAESSGIRFEFVNADRPPRRGRNFFEVFGAGLGAVDFDGDLWPDIYCAQGASLESGGGGEVGGGGDLRDRLFRNRGDGAFDDVTAAARLGDKRFSQGVACGDIDNDGFPDLLIANVGDNSLYHNNGDGTFSDITQQAGINGPQWTVSVAVADLDGDGFPDIYEVNYLGGQEIFHVICDDVANPQRSCRPQDYPSEPDRFFRNSGAGGFEDQTRQAGLRSAEPGLGVVVANLAGTETPAVFVANDGTSNAFFVNGARRGEAPKFADRAVFAGLAADRDGRAQACMGVACGDAQRDGLLDLFATNFFEESNVLYRALGEGLFEDQTRQSELFAPSLKMLGFGTQFLDGDLDGDLDLVVANGHISSAGQGGASFQMRPQLFENLAGRFAETRGSDAGAYFDRELLGRALIRLDFNRDGRDDFAVSHLDAPLALLQNESPAAGHFLAIQLRGVQSDRDAIAATVIVETPHGQRQVAQCGAGDGYMASNQRQLVFGLGEQLRASSIEIRWPSGVVQKFSEQPADRLLLFVEGAPAPWEMKFSR